MTIVSMFKQIDSTKYKLSKRVVLELNSDTIRIVKKRNTRIIMKDSKAILEIAKKIRELEKNINIQLLISGPICGKSVKFLSENGIKVVND